MPVTEGSRASKILGLERKWCL